MTRQVLCSRSHYRAWHSLGTRWNDNDMYGHVNNVSYYAWFDSAVNSYLISADLLDPIGGDVIGLVVESGCVYARPLSFPQPIEIGLAVSNLGRSSVTYQLGVFAQGVEDPAAQGHFTHVYVDRAVRRPISLTPSWRNSLAQLIAPQDGKQ